MQSEEIRKRFLAFFERHDHAIIPSASLVPENDPSVLFNTAGMQPLVPYLLGTKHPKGHRLVNVQKCVRTQDVDEVGDNTHDTFFEMLGNWSLGDPAASDAIGAGYWKKEAIEWSYQFLTSPAEGLGLDPARLYVTVFAGNEDAPQDEESYNTWLALGVPKSHIFWMERTPEGKEPNWWSPGDNGPCGPDTEMFYDVTSSGLVINSREEFLRADEKQQVVEIWNDVFMQYEKKEGRVVGTLSAKNVDTGAGLERLAMVIQGKDNIFETDLFSQLMSDIVLRSSSNNIRARRIVADHLRTVLFMALDGVRPSNTDRGYVMRRLIRRAVRQAHVIGLPTDSFGDLLLSAHVPYGDRYPFPAESQKVITDVLMAEVSKFEKTVARGVKMFEKYKAGDAIIGQDAFLLFTTHGLPIDLMRELAHERGVIIDEAGLESALKEHEDTSRAGSELKFKGGLADTSEMSVKYHTATHLLHQALRAVLGNHVTQKGSNITPERLRFDFPHTKKMSADEIARVETIVNEQIARALPVSYEDISREEARARGAIGLFEDAYGDVVRVYRVGTPESTFSYELCGGPHVTNTGTLGMFKILKEEAISEGIRRIRAVLS